MTREGDRSTILRAADVRRIDSPVTVDCGDAAHAGAGAMAVIPLIEGDRIRAFEVRCQCGASVIVECLYDQPKP